MDSCRTLGEDLKDIVNFDQPRWRAVLETALLEAREKWKHICHAVIDLDLERAAIPWAVGFFLKVRDSALEPTRETLLARL